jgi:hypothetical protein
MLNNHVAQEQGHKGDQTGEHRYKKAVYANPDEPFLCPILALGVVKILVVNVQIVQFVTVLAMAIFCYDARTEERFNLFAGTNTKERFSEALERCAVNLTADEIALLGFMYICCLHVHDLCWLTQAACWKISGLTVSERCIQLLNKYNMWANRLAGSSSHGTHFGTLG